MKSEDSPLYPFGAISTELERGPDLLDYLDAIPFYVMLVDAGHHVLAANAAVKRDLGLEPKQIVGQYCPKVVHGLDEPFPGCPLEEAVEKGQAVERELFDESTGRWLEAAIYPTGQRTQEGRTIFVHMVRDITDEKQAEEEIRRNYQVQTMLGALLHMSLLDISLEELLGLALEYIVSIPWLTLESRGAIFLIEDDPDVLVMKVQMGLAEPIQVACAQVPFGRCHCGRAALTQEIQFAERLDERHETRYEGIVPHGHYCVPIVLNDTTLGVINLYLREGHRRDRREEEFLTAVANTLAGIIRHEQGEDELERSFERLKRLRRTLDGTVAALASVVQTRDPYTARHQERVTELACAIAREMGLPEGQVEGLHVAGHLHDIGKVYVPAEILNRPGRLNEMEMSLVKAHAQVGYEILKNVEFPWPVAEVSYQHHERLDGSGYPRRLSGEDILLEARILAVADVMEAMSSYRPYRPALSLDKALGEISRGKGILYDAAAVEACLRLFAEGRFRFE